MRRSVRFRQSNQRPGNWELTFYLRKVEELAMQSKQVTFAFAVNLVKFYLDLQLAHITNSTWVTLKVDLAFSWMKKRAGF